MRKRILTILLVMVAGGLMAAVLYLNSLMPIITGYAAKNLASAVFISGRSQEAVENLDLNFSFIRFTRNTVDMEGKTVVSRFLWGKSVAIFQEGFGCTLIRGEDADKLLNRIFPDTQRPAGNPDSIAWPVGNLITDTLAGIDREKLAETGAMLMQGDAYGGHAFAFLVMYCGIPVSEWYNAGIEPDTRLLSWSMAKSFTNALAGIMSRDKLLDVNLPSQVDAWQTDERSLITINDLLRMQSGLEWNEDYGNRSDVTLMLHCEPDFAAFVAGKKAAHPAGEFWYYSSGSTNLVSSLMRKSINNDEAYYRYAYEKLFYPLGIRNAVIETDASGTFVGSSYIYATARDYARFALLYLNDGVFDGQRILPEGWVDYSFTPVPGSRGAYGSSFWLNQSNDLKSVLRETAICRGHNGQRIFIVPEHDLAVVVLGYSPKETNDMDFDRLLGDVLAALPGNPGCP